MPPPKRSYELIIADQHLPIDWPTYTFLDADPGYDARLLTCSSHSHGQCGPGGAPYAPAKGLSGKTNRFRARHIGERSLAAAQAMIKQFVIHLDGCQNAEMCFNVLHNERGLSCHFILDNDGTIYQTLDLIDCAYHAAGLNESSIGIEMCNRGDAKKDPTYYDRIPGMIKRDLVTCLINNEKYVAYEFTKPQYEAMEALGKALAKHLPGIKLDYPQSSPGVQNWGTLEPWDLTSQHLRATYTGYLGHYHITNQKWDPGPFDFKKYLSKLSGKRSFPIALHGMGGKSEVPDSPPRTEAEARKEYEEKFQAYYENNELEGGGGFFPVGPLDHAQLYHGGIHLHAEKGSNVVAPFAGKLILARNGDTKEGIGSVNFVLVQSSVSVGTTPITFYTLFMHLMKEDPTAKKKDRLKWMATDAWQDAELGRVVVLAEPVQAGDILGHVGVAGPEGEAQVHWEIFTLDHSPVEKVDKTGFWKVMSGAADQRYVVNNKELLGKLDVKKKDGIITPDELQEVFRGDPVDKDWTRHAVTYHYSEWSVRPDWKQALQDAPEYKKKPLRAKEIEEMVEEQILPTLWWTDDVAQRIGLPAEAWVYTYHPVSFMMWLNDLVGAKVAEVTRKATAEDMKSATGKGKLDIDDHEGTSFVTEAELAELPPSKQLQLPDMVDGYGD